MVKPGYKETEIGVIPEDWDISSLKDLTENCFTYGVNAPAVPYAPPLPNYIRITDISDDGRFIRDNRTSVDCQNSKNYTLKENDIVFARTGASTGKTYLYRKSDGDLVYAGFLIKASILPEKANSKYVFDNLHTNRYWDWVAVTSMRSGQPGINGNEYASYIIPCPSLPEQERIAEALSDADGMISSLEKLIVKKKAIKQGAMQELLTGKKRLPGFTGEWIEKKIEDIADVGRGRVISCIEISKNIGGKYPVYSSQTTNNGIMGYLRTFDFDGDYVTWTTDGVNAGTVFYRNGKFNCTNVCGTLKIRNHNANFISRRLGLETPNYVATNLANPKLMNDVMKKITITVPETIVEQAAIASILSDMDSEVEVLEQKLAKTRQLKQGMMQQLLTGKIRLVTEEKATAAIPITEQTDLLHSRSGHNKQFDDAVMIAAIVNAFYSEKYPLGRKKVQKLLYLLRRKQEEDTSAFKKKAAGPYADEVRYKGGEPIAKRQGYIATATTQKGTAFSKGQAIDVALSYVGKWQMQSDIDWLVSTFKYTKTNDLELYATIDMAICDLQHDGISVSVDSVKDLIRSHEEWKEKLTKTYFSDADIARAISTCKRLYL